MSPLDRALMLMEDGRYEDADFLLTSELLSNPSDDELWMLAGIARFRRGACRSAASAFKMCAWLCGNPEARELAASLEGL